MGVRMSSFARAQTCPIALSDLLTAQCRKYRLAVCRLLPDARGVGELPRKGGSLALCVRTATERECALRIDLTHSAHPRASICAQGAAGIRREPDIADRGGGRRIWADTVEKVAA